MRDFNRKLRLTAALLGASTCKDLARAFHRVNPSTSFEIGRAAKWLQGRAHPREPELYQDWATILGVEEPLAWLLECEADAFTTMLSKRHGVAADVLEKRAAAFGRRGQIERPAAESSAVSTYLCGSYICYRHAFSPYYRGRILRSSLNVDLARGRELVACYEEALPIGPIRAVGGVSAAGRALYIDVVTATGRNERAFVSLFMPQPPASCLAGIYCGTTMIGPHAQPAASRILAIRVPAGSGVADGRDCYLEEGQSIARDLIGRGMRIDGPDELDRVLHRFLRESRGGGIDQIDAADHDGLVAVFDRIWIASGPGDDRPPLL